MEKFKPNTLKSKLPGRLYFTLLFSFLCIISSEKITAQVNVSPYDSIFFQELFEDTDFASSEPRMEYLPY